MANKSTKNTEKATNIKTEEKIETKETVEISSVEKENAELKRQMAEMQEKMNKLFESMALNNAKTNKVDSKKSIKFINMTNGKLVLRGSQIWVFENQFDTRTFMETEAKLIVNNMPKCIRSGNVYIADADFVEENELSLIYNSILSDKELKELFEKNPKDVIETYKMVSDEQKNIIVSMIIEKRNNGEEVDGNILLTIGKLSGKDLTAIDPLED